MYCSDYWSWKKDGSCLVAMQAHLITANQWDVMFPEEKICDKWKEIKENEKVVINENMKIVIEKNDEQTKS